MWKYNYGYGCMSEDELMHYGVKGMKWGVRRRQLNKAGYNDLLNKRNQSINKYMTTKKQAKATIKTAKSDIRTANRSIKTAKRTLVKENRKFNQDYENLRYTNRKNMEAEKKAYKAEKKAAKEAYKQTDEYKAKRAKALKVGVAVAGTALAAYGAYKLHNYIRSENAKIAIKRGEEAFDSVVKKNENEKASLKRISDSFRRQAASAMSERDNNLDLAKYYKDSHPDVSKKYLQEASNALNKVDDYRNTARIADDAFKRLDRFKGADEAFNKAYDSVKNANFVNATKNVYNEHRKRKRR